MGTPGKQGNLLLEKFHRNKNPGLGGGSLSIDFLLRPTPARCRSQRHENKASIKGDEEGTKTSAETTSQQEGKTDERVAESAGYGREGAGELEERNIAP